jgi:hypothetical protein
VLLEAMPISHPAGGRPTSRPARRFVWAQATSPEGNRPPADRSPDEQLAQPPGPGWRPHPSTASPVPDRQVATSLGEVLAPAGPVLLMEPKRTSRADLRLAELCAASSRCRTARTCAAVSTYIHSANHHSSLRLKPRAVTSRP